jgi:hypothetical protein
MRREFLLLREMRDAAVAIRDLVGDRTAEEVEAEPLRRAALWWHQGARWGCQPGTRRDE